MILLHCTVQLLCVFERAYTQSTVNIGHKKCNPVTVETKYQCGQCIVTGGQHKDTVVVGAMTRVDRAVRLTLVTL